MSRHTKVRLVVSVAALLGFAPQAFATCTGSAPAGALQAFDANPAAWIAANGKAGDLGAQMLALASAAVNAKDPNFGKALNTMLGNATADQGTAVGASLGTLGNTCSDPRDPNDVADKQYISLNIAPNMRANGNANTAYGQASGPQTAAAGGGGGGGGGAGGGGGTGVGGPTTTGTTGTGTGTSSLETITSPGVNTSPSGLSSIPAGTATASSTTTVPGTTTSTFPTFTNFTTLTTFSTTNVTSVSPF